MKMRVRLWDSGVRMAMPSSFAAMVVILRADDPELVFPGAHEGAAIGLQRRSNFGRQLAGDGAYGLCGACDLQQGKAARFADLQDGACIGLGAGQG